MVRWFVGATALTLFFALAALALLCVGELFYMLVTGTGGG